MMKSTINLMKYAKKKKYFVRWCLITESIIWFDKIHDPVISASRLETIYKAVYAVSNIWPNLNTG